MKKGETNMKINEITSVEKTSVVLENGVDFDEHDLDYYGTNLVIKESKLNKLAKDNGFDECTKCNSLAYDDQSFVNAVFIRYL